MKIIHIAEKINLNQVMDISVDVHKDNLNFFFAADSREYTDIWALYGALYGTY